MFLEIMYARVNTLKGKGKRPPLDYKTYECLIQCNSLNSLLRGEDIDKFCSCTINMVVNYSHSTYCVGIFPTHSCIGHTSYKLNIALSRNISYTLNIALSMCRNISYTLNIALSMCRNIYYTLNIALSMCRNISYTLNIALSM